MVRELRARLGSAKLLLGSLQGDAHQVASRAQRAALLEAVRSYGASLTAADRADLMVFASEVAWHCDDKASVISALGEAEPSPPSGKKPHRNDMQEFKSISEFFTEAEWTLLCSESAGVLQKREVILSRAAKLSCRCPSETTSKWFASILLVCTGKTDLPPTSKWDTKESLKAEMKSMVRRMKPPLIYLKKLEASPQELMSKHPDLYSEAYRGTEMPVPCKIDLQQVFNVDATYRTRGGGGVGSSANLPASPPPLQLLTSSGGANVGNMAQALMQGIFSMTQSQERMMNMMIMGSGMQPGLANRPMRSLSALADLATSDGQAQPRLSHASFRPPIAITNIRTQASHVDGQARPSSLRPHLEITDLRPQFADSAANEQAAAASAAREQAAALLAARQQAAVAMAIKIEEVDDDAEEKNTDALDLLTALERRDEDKRRSKAEERAAKKTMQAAEHAAKRNLALIAASPLPKETSSTGNDRSTQKVLKRPSSSDVCFGEGAGKAVLPMPAGGGSWSHCHEKSRSQFMARSTVKGPGSSKRFKYGGGQEYHDEASAAVAVKNFVAEKNRSS